MPKSYWSATAVNKSTPVPTLAYIALGSNLGDRAAYLARARAAIAALPGTRLAGEGCLVQINVSARSVGETKVIVVSPHVCVNVWADGACVSARAGGA